VLVAVPASTSGCTVLDRGRISAGDGDSATFLGLVARGLVVTTRSRGLEQYVDSGASVRVLSSRVDALICAAPGTRASIFGRARINGAGSFEYRIDLERSFGRLTYRIRLSSGYDSGVQRLRGARWPSACGPGSGGVIRRFGSRARSERVLLQRHGAGELD
jgi:hypothetical protein